MKIEPVENDFMKPKESVEHPAHYHAEAGVEVIEAIRAWSVDDGLSFCLGNVIKYVARCQAKHDTATEDLMKARWYLDYALNNILGVSADED